MARFDFARWGDRCSRRCAAGDDRGEGCHRSNHPVVGAPCQAPRYCAHRIDLLDVAREHGCSRDRGRPARLRPGHRARMDFCAHHHIWSLRPGADCAAADLHPPIRGRGRLGAAACAAGRDHQPHSACARHLDRAGPLQSRRHGLGHGHLSCALCHDDRGRRAPQHGSEPRRGSASLRSHQGADCIAHHRPAARQRSCPARCWHSPSR